MIQKVVLNSSEKGVYQSSIEEDIIIKKKEFIPVSEFKGPTTELFFHELENRRLKRDSALSKVIGYLLYIVHLITLPILWGSLKLSGVQKPIISYSVNGLNGYSFELRHYNIGIDQGSDRKKSETNGIQTFLFKTGLYKLPQSLHLIRGKMNYQGPEPLKKDVAKKYVSEYTDFYKRYAVRPGLLSPVSYFNLHANNFSPEKNLKAELNYLALKTIR